MAYGYAAMRVAIVASNGGPPGRLYGGAEEKNIRRVGFLRPAPIEWQLMTSMVDHALIGQDGWTPSAIRVSGSIPDVIRPQGGQHVRPR